MLENAIFQSIHTVPNYIVSAMSRMLADPMLDVLPLLRVSELLHAHQTDKTHTDVENRDLVNTFSTFFVSKITEICARGRGA